MPGPGVHPGSPSRAPVSQCHGTVVVGDEFRRGVDSVAEKNMGQPWMEASLDGPLPLQHVSICILTYLYANNTKSYVYNVYAILNIFQHMFDGATQNKDDLFLDGKQLT